MESEPNRPSDLMRAGFITDTIASCDGPVNEHQIVVCEFNLPRPDDRRRFRRS